MITPEFKEKLSAYKSKYDTWISNQSVSTVRLVHYCGVDKPNCSSVDVDDIWREIEDSLAEGFYVDWNIQKDAMFILVQEPGCPIPSWQKVYAEEEIENVDEILRQAGFNIDT